MLARFSSIVLCALALSTPALAQDLQNSEDGYLAPKLVLGFGGEGELDGEGPGSVEDDLELTYGFGAAYMHPLHQYFALGGQLIVASWQTELGEEADADRSTYVDLSVVPQLKYAVSSSVELYASIPLGLTFNFLGSDDDDDEIGTGVGFNLALMLGARFAIGESWGLLGEIGYVYHSFTHTVEVATPVGTVEGDIDVSLGQIGLNVGAWFAL